MIFRYYILLLLFVSTNSVIFAAPLPTNINPTTKSSMACGEHGDCLTVTPDCTGPCGCDNLYYYSNTTNKCILNLEFLKEIMTERFNTEEKIRAEAENVFKGIIVSVIIFGACSALCTLSACMYCAHINLSDRRLRKNLKALSQKLKRDGKLPKAPKKPTQANAQSCNVVVEDAGVFVC